jgi:hypothetical protein
MTAITESTCTCRSCQGLRRENIRREYLNNRHRPSTERRPTPPNLKELTLIPHSVGDVLAGIGRR